MNQAVSEMRRFRFVNTGAGIAARMPDCSIRPHGSCRCLRPVSAPEERERRNDLLFARDDARQECTVIDDLDVKGLFDGFDVAHGEQLRAAALFEELKETDRAADAAQMLAKTQYGWACRLVEDGEYMKAFAKAKAASAYVNVGTLLDALNPLLYEEMIDCYRDGEWSAVISRCDALGKDYEFSWWYRSLATIHIGEYASDATVEETLLPYIGYEDVNELLLLDEQIADYFLLGFWSGSGGSLHFYLKSISLMLEYDLPAQPFGEGWHIDKGILYFGNRKERRPIYKLEILDENTIKVYAYKNQRMYTLIRQG